MDRLDALQQENKELRRQNSQQGDSKLKLPNIPVIEGNLNDSEWSLFFDTLGRHKVMTALSVADKIRMELRAACSIVGPAVLDTANKGQLLSHIKTIAVKGLHQEVYRVNDEQEDCENVTHFVARLKAQAALCSFTVSCSCNENVSFAEEMVTKQLVAGLRDQEHQSKVLAKASSLATLYLKVEGLQSLEARRSLQQNCRFLVMPANQPQGSPVIRRQVMVAWLNTAREGDICYMRSERPLR